MRRAEGQSGGAGAAATGARAAAADLRRVRGETEVAPTVAPERLALAREITTTAEKLLKTHRMYRADAPAVTRFAREVADLLARYTREHGALVLRLGPRELSLEGAPVAAAGSAGDNPWYGLFRDGVRELRLAAGVEAETLARFAGALTQLASAGTNDDRDAPEDDAVTLVWALALEGIELRAGPALRDPDDAAALVARMGAERLATCELSARGAHEQVGAPSPQPAPLLQARELQFLERENLASLAPVPPEVTAQRGDLFRMADDERLLLADLLASDDPALVPRAIAAMSSAWLDGDGGRELADRVADALASALADALADALANAPPDALDAAPDAASAGHDLADATAIAAAIGTAVAGAAQAGTLDVGRLTALIDAVAATPACAHVAKAYAAAHGDRHRQRATIGLIRALPPALLEPLAEARAAIADAAARGDFDRDLEAARSASRRQRAPREARPQPRATDPARPGRPPSPPATHPPSRPARSSSHPAPRPPSHPAPQPPSQPAPRPATAPPRPARPQTPPAAETEPAPAPRARRPPRASAAELAAAAEDVAHGRRSRSLHESLSFHISAPRSRENVFPEPEPRPAPATSPAGAEPDNETPDDG